MHFSYSACVFHVLFLSHIFYNVGGPKFVEMNSIKLHSKTWFLGNIYKLYNIFTSWCLTGRSQWLRGLRHEMSSLSRTLGLWVRIQLKTWMSVCVYSVFMQVAALRRADLASKESYRLSWKNKWNERFTDALCSKWEQQQREREGVSYWTIFATKGNNNEDPSTLLCCNICCNVM
jgi:hypothetical protein